MNKRNLVGRQRFCRCRCSSPTTRGQRYRPLLALFLFSISLFTMSCSKREKATELQGDGLHVPEGFEIFRAVPPDMVSYPMFATLDNQGRLFVIESSGKTTSTDDVLKNPTFKILLLEDNNDDGVYDNRKVFADKIAYPMGGTFYKGSFYVAAPPDLLRFRDSDNDGVADEREVILTGWTLNHNAATLSGPFFGPDGWLYLCDARRGFKIKTKEGNELSGKGARIWRCRPDGTGLESVSGGGFDNTIELIFMPGGETIGTMTYFTDPRDGFRDALMHWVEGGVYSKPHPVIEEDKLKLTGDLMPVMTKMPRVSPSGLMRYRSSGFGKEYEGNLFSAQFNTGRVMRHVITPVGATFRTEDAAFMTSDSLDMHPTDVLEDADGSLLVVNTGGWFIAGCPLSVVAKPDKHGGIFRIRKVNTPRIEDPWGKQVNFKSMSLDSISNFLDDPRPAVRENAREEIIEHGEAAIDVLYKILISSSAEHIRAAAVFALYRIHLPVAIDAVRVGLNDKSAIVRTAAARVLGMAKDPKAIEKLSELVGNDSASVRRQAAIALGQIGDKRATGALLSASANPDDRVVDHAIIYSLITLGSTEALVRALENPLENVRRSALIALDQTDGSPLSRSHVLPFLQSKNTELRDIGMWVLSHHTDWSDIVVNFLASHFKSRQPAAHEDESITNLMIAFSGEKRLQKFVSDKTRNPATPEVEKLLFLDVISRCVLEDLPVEWIRLLEGLLQEENLTIRSRVLDLMVSRSIPELDRVVEKIIENPETAPPFKLKALGARITSHPKLSDSQFTMLLAFLKPEIESPVRQSAVRLLVQAELSDVQLVKLATEEIPVADIFLVPGLVSAFQDNQSADVGEALIKALNSSPDRLDNLALLDVEKLFEKFPASVQTSGASIIKILQQKQGKRLAELENLQAQLGKGDVGSGRQLFFGKALCSTCHAIIGQGGNFGPDLTNIGEIRSQHDILEAILFPSASFAREYETSKVVTNSTSYTGIIKQQLPETIIMETGPGTMMQVSRNDVKTIEPQNVSFMPPGLDKQLTLEEMADLMAYLTSLPDGLGHLKTN